MRLAQLVSFSAAVLATALILSPQAGSADAQSVLTVTAQGGRFTPQQLQVSANRPFKVRVVSAEKTPIEFESFELRRERVVRPGETITVNMPPLGPGTYKFFDDFHRDTPQGAIVVGK